MPRPKYPLQPLLQHRERRVDHATAELGRAIQTREAAEAQRLGAERARRDAEVRARAVKAEEVQRLERGELRAVDLARVEAWDVAARLHIEQLSDALEAAEAKELRAVDEEELSRKDLAGKTADRDVVAKDAARFDARLQHRVMLAEEEAAEEARAGRIHPKEGPR